MRSLVTTIAVLIGSWAMLPAGAGAAEVYFNGVRVSGALKNQTFKNCHVRFDNSGNVHITAKGYEVKKLGDGAKGGTSDTSDSVSKQYYLYSRATKAGAVQYDIDVYINGKWVRKIRNTENQVVLDVSKKLRKGKNVIHFAATKNYGGKPRKSSSPSDYVQVFVGRGTKGGGTVNITSVLASFKAPASRTDNFGQEMSVEVK